MPKSRVETQVRLVRQGLATAGACFLSCLAVLCLTGCGEPRGRKVAGFEMEDLSAPAMFKELGIQLRLAYVLELPEADITERHDLKLGATDEASILKAICALDGNWESNRTDRVMTMIPTGRFAEAETSAYAANLPSFRANGGVFTVLQELMATGVERPTTLACSPEGKHRAVVLDMQDTTVREVLAEIAAQAKLAIIAKPGMLSVTAVRQQGEDRLHGES